MHSWKRCCVVALAGAVLIGCRTTTLLEARFDGSGSPQGSLPGAPAGDLASVDDPTEPEQEGGFLYWRPPPHGKVRLQSAPYAGADTTKTIYWEGRRTAGDTDFVVHIGAEDADGAAPTVPLILTMRGNTVWAQGHIGPVKHSADFDANKDHSVFVSLRVGSGQYAITIKSTGAPEIQWTGFFEKATKDRLISQRRLVMEAGFKEENKLKGIFLRQV